MKNPLILALVAVAASLVFTDTRAAVGRTPGQFAVSATGGAQYSIPIWTPPGPRGIQPNLALVYDSHGGIGSLGVGWQVAGLGAISRCNKTYAQDTTPAAVALATSDGYCLNGNRLRLTAGTYGAAGSTYQTEIANFSNVTAVGTAGNGPASFAVQGRDGLTYEYGFTDTNGNGANSQVLATGTSTAVAWLLSKVIDRAGNNYVINYTTLTGTAVPNTILWTPTSHGASTYAYSIQFNYTTNVPQSSLTKYIGGTALSNNKLLSSIAISSSGTVVKDYFLGYQASPTTGRDELISVKECADSTQTNCLSATTVTYQNGAAGISTTATTALTATTGGVVARYDLNGDGIPDLIYGTGTSHWVAFGSGTGTYGTPVNIGITPYLMGNLTGGSKDGILTQISGVWWYYLWNGTSFVGTSTGLAVDSALQYQLADINGDGLPDLVGLYYQVNTPPRPSVTKLQFRLNTSSGATPSFSSTLTYAITVQNGAQLWAPDNQNGMLRHYDFDGDGRDDLVIVEASGSPASVQTYELISTGTSFNQVLVSSVLGSTYVPVFFADWNDDACTDFVTTGTLYISGCNGTIPTTSSVGNVVAALDWDGDGRTDVVVVNGSTLGVRLSTGAGVGTLLSTSIPYSAACQYVTMDVAGNGQDDLGCVNNSTPFALTYRLHNGSGQVPDLLSSIKDGYGNSASPTYTPLAGASNYAQYSDAVFPYQNYIGSLYVVKNAQFTDASNMPSGIYTKTYYYYGAWTNLQGRGFQAFYAKDTVDSRTTLHELQYYERAFPYTGMPFQDIVENSAHYTSQSTATPAMTTLDSTANNQRYFPYFNHVNVWQKELGGSEDGDLITTTSTSYTYDNYGNATTVATTVTDNDPTSPYLSDTWTSTTANTIAPNTSTWCLSLPTETQVTNSSTAPGGTAITRTVTYTPDYTNCRETQKLTEPSSATYKVTEAYLYDAFGNLQTNTVTGVGMTARTSTVTWGTTGQFPTVLTNALSQSVTRGYDPATGNLTSQTDPNYTAGNPIKTTWGYDPFQRKASELRPDGTSTTWTYNACATLGCVNTNNQMTVTKTAVNVGGTTQAVTNAYLDSVDRTLVASSTMLNGAYDRNEVQYDNMGRVHQRGAPCTFVSCTNYWTTFTYDVLNRVTESQRPISATNSTLQSTLYAYTGRSTTVTDALNNTTSKINLVNGALAQSKDAKGYYQNFTYDAFGALLSVTDSASNTLSTNTYHYGLSAFKTASTDMDLGARSYTVDALGEVTAYSDAKTQNFSVIYDALSRPTSRTEPDLTTTWVWGNTAASYNIGKLQSVTGASSAGSFVDAYTYDSKTRLSTRSLTLPGDATYVYTNTYNATTGLLDTLQYPVSTSAYQLKLQYAYANGYLKSVADYNAPATVFWTANTTNPRGQVTQETLGNGVVTTRAFDAVTSWMGSNQAGIGSGAGLLNNSYVFDVIGNVTQRQDGNLGLTENFYYDTDYRLDHSTLNGTANLQMVYDTAGMGNIASRSDVAGGATWTYDSVRKHAVTQAGSSAFTYSYDANGNAQSRNGNSISWTSYNYPSGINAPGESTEFFYGPDRDRWKTIYTGSIGTETTYHVGKLLEKVANGGTLDYRHYIFAGNESVAIYSRMSAGTNTLRYTLTDHLASIASILTDTGTSVVNESFTAYGNRRSAQTWSGAPSTADETAINGVTRQGYTGQTVLGVSMGLNHLNGRVEDAITGRFLSPDPRGIDPSNTQSYNRYSYVQNRPLTMTDPTGFTVGYVKPGMPCKDNCYIPAGIGRWKPSLASSVFGGQVGADSRTGVVSGTGNSGDSSFSGMSGNDITGSSDFAPGGVNAPFTGPDLAPPSGGTPAKNGGSGSTPTADSSLNQGPAQSPFPSSCDADCQAMQVTVDGHYMDAPKTAAPPIGVNYSLYFSSPDFRQYSRAINFVGMAVVIEVGLVEVALPVVAGAGIPAAGSTAAVCTICMFNVGGDLANFGVDAAETLGTTIPMETTNIGAALGTTLEYAEETMATAWRFLQTISGP